MTVIAPTRFDHASQRAPWVCTMCGRNDTPVVALPSVHQSVDGNHQICPHCITDLATLVGLEVVADRGQRNDREEAWRRLNERNAELKAVCDRLARVIKSMADSGYTASSSYTVWSPHTFRGFRDLKALAAHHREQGITDPDDPVDLEQMIDLLIEEVAS